MFSISTWGDNPDILHVNPDLLVTSIKKTNLTKIEICISWSKVSSCSKNCTEIYENLVNVFNELHLYRLESVLFTIWFCFGWLIIAAL